MRKTAVLFTLAILCSCACPKPEQHMIEKYSKAATQARIEKLSQDPPVFSENEVEAIRSRMRARELERFPLEKPAGSGD